jgi:tetratricopeptide (TPR) repeat protein
MNSRICPHSAQALREYLRSMKRAWRVATAILGFTWMSLSAAPPPIAPEPASTNWLTAQNTFQKAGGLIGEKKWDAAKRTLMAAGTNLAAPYSGLATQFVQRLEGILREKELPSQTERAAELCADLQAYDAALKLRPAKPILGEDETDDAGAWWLFENGDLKTALGRYQQKLAQERISVYKDYYRKQVQMIESWATNAANSAFALKVVRERHMKNFERKRDPWGALRQLHRVSPHVGSSTNGAKVYEQIIICLSALGDEAGRNAWENKLVADFKSDAEACAGVYYDRGIRAYHQSHDLETSLRWMRKLCGEFPDAKLWGDGQYSVGLILQDQKKYDEAIAAFGAIFPSKVNDYLLEEGSSEDCKNYRYKAALRISECYESKKDLARALEFAQKARGQYAYVSFCSLCQTQTRAFTDKRVAELEEKIKRAK